MKQGGIKRWVILAGLFVVSFLENGSSRSFAVILNDLTEQFQTTTAFLGALFGIVFGASYIFAFVTIPLLRRFSLRQLAIIGGLLASVGLVCSSVVSTASQFTAAMIAYGIGYILLISPTNACPADYFPDHFDLSNGIFFSGGSAGVMLLPLLFEILVSYYGWRGAMLVLGAINAHLLVSGALLERPTPRVEAIEGSQQGPDVRNECVHNSESLQDCPSGRRLEVAEDEVSEKETECIEPTVTFTTKPGSDGQDKTGPEIIVSVISLESNRVTEVQNEQVSELTPTPYSSPVAPCERVHAGHANNKGITQLLLAPIRFFELNIFKEHPLLIVVCTQALFYGMSYSGWLLFVIPNGLAKGLSITRSVQLSIVGGICNFFGRLGGGMVSSIPNMQADLLYYVINIISATGFLMNLVAESFEFLLALSAVYGFMQGAKIPLVNHLALDAVGKERFSTGLSMMLVCVGISAPISGAMFGAIFDVTSSYNAAFCVIGVLDIMVAHIAISPRLVSCCCRRHRPPLPHHV